MTMTSDVDHRPYTPAELDAIRRRTPAEARAIRDAGDAGEHARADFLGCLAMRTAAYYLQRGAVDEAHELLRRAAAAWHEGRFGVESSFTCPACGRTSYNPNDVRESYCGACHDWTGARA